MSDFFNKIASAIRDRKRRYFMQKANLKNMDGILFNAQELLKSLERLAR